MKTEKSDRKQTQTTIEKTGCWKFSRVFGIDLYIKCVGEVAPPWGEKLVYKYRLLVEGPKGAARFYLFGSIADREKGNVDGMKPEEAFTMVIDDAVTGLSYNDIDSLARELSIEKPSEAIRIFKGVKEAYRKIKKISGLSDDGLADLADKLRDKWG